MKDESKTKKQLIQELDELRRKNAELRENESKWGRVEDVLRESEERFSSIIDKTNAGYFFIDRDGKFQHVNDAWLQMHKYGSLNEVIGQHFAITQVEVDLDQAQKIVEILLSGGPIPSGEFSRRCKDGSIAYHTFSVNPVVQAGQVVGLEGFLIDITERKLAEDALRQIDERFKLMVIQSPSVIELYDLDGLQIDVNKAYEELWGFPASQTVNEFNVLKSKEVIDTGLRDYVDRAYAGEAVDVPVYEFDPRGETEAKGKGRVRWLSTRIYPLKDESNKVSNIVITHEDITVRKILEIELRKSEKKYHSLFEYANDSILLIDPTSHRFLDVNENAVERLGYTREEFLKLKGSAIAPYQPADITETVIRKLKEGGSIIFENIHLHKDGTKIPVEISSRIIEYDGQKVIQSFVRDITERKQVEEQIKAALAEKTVLLQEVHHRVKNNLSMLIAMADMQAMNTEDPEVLRALESIQGRIRAMGMVQERLYQTEDLGNIKLGEFIEELTSQLHYAIGSDRAIRVRVDVDDSHIDVDVNRAITCGLIVNELVTNALKYAFPDRAGEIRVGLREREDEYILVVSDNGAGMPPDLDWQTTESLGMKFVNLWATYQLEGSLEVDEKNGTTFTIRFPK